MNRIVFPSVERDLRKGEELLEELVLTASFLRGRRGLEQLLTPDIALTEDERDDVAKHLAGAAARVSFEQVMFKLAGATDFRSNVTYEDTLRSLAARTISSLPVGRETRFNQVMDSIANGAPVMCFVFGRKQANGNPGGRDQWPFDELPAAE